MTLDRFIVVFAYVEFVSTYFVILFLGQNAVARLWNRPVSVTCENTGRVDVSSLSVMVMLLRSCSGIRMEAW